MKREQEAYNAKMNAKIQEQLNGWVALRENMTTFSLQIKSLGSYAHDPRQSRTHASLTLLRVTNQCGPTELEQQQKKKKLKTLVNEKKVQLLTSSER